MGANIIMFRTVLQPLVFLATTVLVSVAAGLVLDGWAVEAARSIPPGWRSGLYRLTRLGEGVEILVISAALFGFAAYRSIHAPDRRLRVGWSAAAGAAGYVFVATAVAGLVAALAKNMIGRARPSLYEAEGILSLTPFAFDSAHASWPSGHSATCGAATVALALVFPRWRILILAVGIGIAATRAGIRAHYVSDVIAGFGLGAAVSLALAGALARRARVFRAAADAPLRWRRPRRAGRHLPRDAVASILAASRQLVRRLKGPGRATRTGSTGPDPA